MATVAEVTPLLKAHDKAYDKTHNKRSSYLVSFISRGIAGGTEAAVTYPLEFVKTRVQLYNARSSNNPFTLVAHVVRHDGVRALYTGCSALVLVSTMGKYSILFASFSQIKTLFADLNTGKLTPIRSLLASGTAGVVASVLAVVPSERIKTAMVEDAGSQARFKSPLHAARLLIREQGFRVSWPSAIEFPTESIKDGI